MSYKYVYLFAAIDAEYFKIGISNDWQCRLSSIQEGMPFELVSVLAIMCENPREIESAILAQFTEDSSRGEWFRVEEDMQWTWLHEVARVIRAQLEEGGEWPPQRWVIEHCHPSLMDHFDREWVPAATTIELLNRLWDGEPV